VRSSGQEAAPTMEKSGPPPAFAAKSAATAGKRTVEEGWHKSQRYMEAEREKRTEGGIKPPLH
jgi:hypothetical protein